MSKTPNTLDVLSLMNHEAKLKKAEEKQISTQERIQAVLEGEKPTDPLSWEFHIWMSYNDPFYRMRKG